MEMTNVLFLMMLCLYELVMFMFYLKAKTRRAKVITSFMMALGFALSAYAFVPKSSYDLVRHHEMAENFAQLPSFSAFLETIGDYDLELLPQLYSFMIAKIGDYNLMQSIIVLIGYGLLFYILKDYKDHKRLTNGKFLMVVLLIIFGQHILFYFSGLYNYFVINLFAFATYIDYVKRRKKIAWVIYLLSPLIHSSMFLPLLLMVFLKMKKGKITIRTSFVFAIILLLFSTIMNLIVGVVDINYLSGLVKTYNNYMLHNDYMMSFYDGFYLFMSITKIFIVLLACWMQRKSSENEALRNFAYLMSVAIIILSFSSIAITRFSSLALFVALPLIFDIICQKNRNAARFMVLISGVAMMYFLYSLWTIIPYINVLRG